MSEQIKKNSEIIKGEIIIVTIAIKIDTIMDKTIIVRWDIPLDFSERRNECKAVGRISNPNLGSISSRITFAFIRLTT